MIINFYAGTVGAGKTAQLIEDYKELYNPFVVKVIIDKEPQLSYVVSRNGQSAPCLTINANDSADEILASLSIYIEKYGITEHLLIDEAQFLNPEQIGAIESVALIASVQGIIFYGLVYDFKGRFFKGSEWLLQISDNVFTIHKECEISYCHQPAVLNARIIDGKLIKEGELFVADKSLYKALCVEHYSQLS